MSRLGAARVGDPVGHGLGMAGLIAGAVVGALAGAAFLAGTAVTGGALAAAAIGAGALAGGALSGQALARGLGTLFGAGMPTTGMLASGSPDVFVNGRPAIRAGVDHVAECSGLYATHHGALAEAPVAEGSATVRVNGRPMARVTSRLACAAEVTEGSPDVFVGGPTEQALAVVDNEHIVTQVFAVLGLAAAGAGALAAATAGAAALGGYVLLGVAGTAGAAALDKVGRWLGPGWGDILQGGAGLALLVGPAAVRARGPAAQRAAAEAAAAERAAAQRTAAQRARQTGAGGDHDPADAAYESIRASTTDVDAIAQNTGIKPKNIQKVKDHVFYAEHLLDRYARLGIEPEVKRFDSHTGIADAWRRLTDGTHTAADLQLLRHETAEAWFMRRHGPGYDAAHTAAQRRFPSPF